MTYIIPEEQIEAVEMQKAVYASGTKEAVYAVLCSIFGLLLGVGLYAYIDNCDGLECGQAQEVVVTAPEGEVEVDAAYVPPEPVVIDETLTQWDTVPSEDVRDLVSEEASEEYLLSLSELQVLSNALGTHLRQDVPNSLFAIQDLATTGDLQGIFDAVVVAQITAVEASDMTMQFSQQLDAVEANISGTSGAVQTRSQAMLDQGRIAAAIATEFVGLALRLSEPSPPAQSDIDAVEPLGVAIQTSFNDFADSVDLTIVTIKLASGE